MNRKLLSIIVPVYGEDEYLDQCIESIINQTYNNIEIILVDDGSPDKCPEICDIWAKKDHRIIVIHKTNGGLVSARKAGIAVSNGEYIGYVDGDDWIDSNYYETLINLLEINDVDLVSCGYSKELFGKSIIGKNPLAAGLYDRKQLEAEVYHRVIYDETISQGVICTYVWNKVFKRKIVYDHQMRVDERIVIGEDSMCVYPTIFECNSIYVSEYAGYHYRQRTNSLLRSSSANTQVVQKLYNFYNSFISRINEKMAYWNVKKQLNSYYLCQLIMMVDSLMLVYPDLEKKFPFFDIEENNKVIIYSAGAFGIHLYNYYSTNTFVEIVAWADPDYMQYSRNEYNIISLRESIETPFDKIIIASLDKEFISKAHNEIEKLGICRNKISDIDGNFDEIQKSIERIGLIHE